MNRWNDFVIGTEEKRRNRDKFDLLTTVHKAEYGRIQRPLNKKTGQPIEPAHKFEVNLEGDSFTKEKYDVFLKYQLQIHKDPASRWKESAFKRFLCAGLDRKILKMNGKTLKLGSYHQCYRLDGRLVAVGVLDLLPHAVSSVYLFYDPEFAHWDFGKISALREIALALEGHYEYYYMGYYIHSCIKMRYKARFGPSYLLDPESFEWNLFDDKYRSELDKRKYVCPSHDRKYGIASNETHDSATSNTASSDAEIPEGSLFDFQIPGVLSKDEVKRLDLDHWRLLVRNALIELEDLRGWEDWKIDDPGSIKGIAAELIAATGPKLLQNSALALF
ncbi:hypothetical protein A1O1_03939 [Capronia coronata CBS 617.96]|uniref:N-end rule aminoacyl transferase C-terminal domain-containing protein n=1 Tax=Capronia coronata CBS 617.96 TaxID=1182541 RepID=W9Z8M3_9EURO|nr:uncharacterized protein A1O1_03939 [Capronia coronata CBS 617.96]EXJ90834.1 hypothetical protein A1O1_03939 [Capronia coronata CBS 617.96]